MFQINKYDSTKIEKLALTISSGSFLTFCLFAYQAYNIQSGFSVSGHSLLFRAIIFGLFISLSFAFNEYLIHPKLNFNFNIIQWRVWEIWFGGTVTFLWFNYFWNWQEWFVFAYFQITIECAGILIIPILGSYFLRKYLDKNNLLEKSKLEFEKEIAIIRKERFNLNKDQITFKSTNEKTQLNIAVNDFLYATSADNYVQIYYLSNNEVKHILLRSTLKILEKQFINFPFLRCHRSYFINKENIIQIKKSSTKTLIQLKDINKFIPVSKKYEMDILPK